MLHLKKKTKHFCILYSLSHIWGNSALSALLPRAEGHPPSQTIVPLPVLGNDQKRAHSQEGNTHLPSSLSVAFAEVCPETAPSFTCWMHAMLKERRGHERPIQA